MLSESGQESIARISGRGGNDAGAGMRQCVYPQGCCVSHRTEVRIAGSWLKVRMMDKWLNFL